MTNSAQIPEMRQGVSRTMSHRTVAMQIALGCSAALVASGLTAGVRIVAPDHAFWFMYMPVIGLAAYFGSQLAGVIAAVASILSVWY